MKELKFSLKLKEVSVTIADVDGQEKSYILRELTGEQRDSFLDDVGKRLKYSASGKVQGFSNFKGLQSGLLMLSLYDMEGQSISEKELLLFPSSVISDLYKTAQTLSGLAEEKEEEEAKNE